MSVVGALIFACAVSSVAGDLYDSRSDVVQLTPDNFDSVLRSANVWLVEFYAPWCGHCKNLVPEYTKAARALKGIVKVGAVNADEHKSLGTQYGVSGFPTIKLFVEGQAQAYTGARSADALVEAALQAARDKARSVLGHKPGADDKKSDVVTLTDANFDSVVLNSEELWLVEFYAPWCGHCKNLEPHWARAAADLKGKVKVGALDATVHQATAARFSVQGYPTIKWFAAGRKSASDAQEYSGGRTSSDIVSFALDKLAATLPAPEILEVVSESVWSECTGHPLCVLSVLPHILDCDAACRNGYLDTLRVLADKYKTKQWGWVWTEAGAQPELEEGLELGGFGYPALAVLSAKKLKLSTLRGPFSVTGIDEFLRDLSYGRGGTAPVRGAQVPRARPAPAWDGQDGTPPPPEDDIDLSDVELERDEL